MKIQNVHCAGNAFVTQRLKGGGNHSKIFNVTVMNCENGKKKVDNCINVFSIWDQK